MEKKNVIAYLSSMECDIAEVIVRYNTGTYLNIIVYLNPDPSNDDFIIPSKHWYIYGSIDEFRYSLYFLDPAYEIVSIEEFITDFKDEIDPDENDNKIKLSVNHGKTIRWYKVKCSLFKHEFGVKMWDDLIDFMKRNIGFDYTITGQYTEPYTGVEGYYKNGEIHKL